jgi:dTDP-4-amino-4,6-dideoxygalactose transaminase
VRKQFLSFSPPLIGEEEIDEVVATLRSDWITTGPRVRRFEQEFARALGAPAALALNSCTSALHVALTVLGIGHESQVITTPLTFCSTVHVIEHVGAQPLLVDVEPDTLNIDPVKVEQAVRRSSAHGDATAVRALLPVHLYGHPCELDQLEAIARASNLAVIEDCAHSLPAKYNGRFIGTMRTSVGEGPGQLAAFSFYATKNMTTAEGGMLTGSSALVEAATVWSLHGMSRDAYRRYSAAGSWRYDVLLPGFKYNMTDIQAALGIHQLRRLPELQRRRRHIVAQYNEAFADHDALEIPTERPGVEHSWHIYALRLKLNCLRIDRRRFIEELTRLNIGASVHFIPIHLHTYYRNKYGFKPMDFPVAFTEYQRLVSLPLYPRMTDVDVKDVVDAVHRIASRHRTRRFATTGAS